MIPSFLNISLINDYFTRRLIGFVDIVSADVQRTYQVMVEEKKEAVRVCLRVSMIIRFFMLPCFCRGGRIWIQLFHLLFVVLVCDAWSHRSIRWTIPIPLQCSPRRDSIQVDCVHLMILYFHCVCLDLCACFSQSDVLVTSPLDASIVTSFTRSSSWTV